MLLQHYIMKFPISSVLFAYQQEPFTHIHTEGRRFLKITLALNLLPIYQHIDTIRHKYTRYTEISLLYIRNWLGLYRFVGKFLFALRYPRTNQQLIFGVIGRIIRQNICMISGDQRKQHGCIVVCPLLLIRGFVWLFVSNPLALCLSSRLILIWAFEKWQ